ncbi:transposase [Rhizobium beringeri]|uniref:transposase n=1 Tax=Rhizobium beringeri TaxID=3019934 RepID=UPI003B59E695
MKDEALSLWTARRRHRGWSAEILGSGDYVVLDLRVVYGCATPDPGLMRSVAALMGFDIAVPDFSTFSPEQRAGVAVDKAGARASGPVYLVVDSTG